MVVIGYMAIACAAFALVTFGAASWIYLPRGKLNHLLVRMAANLTWGLRSGTARGKVFYWLMPVFLLFFISWLAGLMLLVAYSIGAIAFVPKYRVATAPVV